jgi:hypothetical protein
MRVLIAAIATALLTVPAYSQAGGVGNSGQGGGRGHRAQAPAVDPAKTKADEKAFNDAVSRIPSPEKKYDPWGVVRQSGK